MNHSLATLVVLTYNQEQYVRDAIHGAFSQTYSPLEIIISDDFSQDRTFDIIQEEVAKYHGPHKVVVNRNERNLGIVRHLNHLIFDLLDSEYLILAAGDDVALPHRVDIAMRMMQSHRCLAGCSNAWKVDKLLQGEVPLYKWNNERKWEASDGILTASLFLRRSLLLESGPIPDYMRGEGMWITAHALAKGDILYSPEYAIKYRQLEGSISGAYCSKEREKVIEADKNMQKILLTMKQDFMDRGLYDGQAKKFISALYHKKVFKLVCLDSSKGFWERFIAWVRCIIHNPPSVRDFTDIIRPDQVLH